jgi:hypothetical protein
MLHEYNEYIPVLPLMKQLFINTCCTTCFDPNGSSSGAAYVCKCENARYSSVVECVRRAAPEYGLLGSKHVVLHMLINN